MKSVLPKIGDPYNLYKAGNTEEALYAVESGTAGILVMTIPITFIPSGMHITVL